MKLGQHIDHGTVWCSECGNELNCSVGAEGDSLEIEVGDFTLCLHCGGISVIDDQGQLRQPGVEELLAAHRDPIFDFKRKAAEAFIIKKA